MVPADMGWSDIGNWAALADALVDGADSAGNVVRGRVDLSGCSGVFATTDGLLDQIGGERQIKFGKRRLQNLLQRVKELPMSALANQLLQHHHTWQGSQERRDDLTFWGFRHP